MPRVDGLTLGISIDTAAFEAGLRRASQAVERSASQINSAVDPVNTVFRAQVANVRGVIREVNALQQLTGREFVNTRSLTLATRDLGRFERGVRRLNEEIRGAGQVARYISDWVTLRETMRQNNEEFEEFTEQQEEFNQRAGRTRTIINGISDAVNNFSQAQEGFAGAIGTTIRATRRLNESVGPLGQAFRTITGGIASIGGAVRGQGPTLAEFATNIVRVVNANTRFDSTQDEVTDSIEETSEQTNIFSRILQQYRVVASNTTSEVDNLAESLSGLGETLGQNRNQTMGYVLGLFNLARAFGGVAAAVGRLNQAQVDPNNSIAGAAESLREDTEASERSITGILLQMANLIGLLQFSIRLLVGELGTAVLASGARATRFVRDRFPRQEFLAIMNTIANSFTAASRALVSAANRIFTAAGITGVGGILAGLAPHLDRVSRLFRLLGGRLRTFSGAIINIVRGIGNERGIPLSPVTVGAGVRNSLRDVLRLFRRAFNETRGRFRQAYRERFRNRPNVPPAVGGVGFVPGGLAGGAAGVAGRYTFSTAIRNTIETIGLLSRALFSTLPIWVQMAARFTVLAVAARTFTTVALPAIGSFFDVLTQTAQYRSQLGLGQSFDFGSRIANLNFFRNLTRVQDFYADGIRIFFNTLIGAVRFFGQLLEDSVYVFLDGFVAIFNAAITLTLPNLLRDYWQVLLDWRDNYIQRNLGGNTISIFEFFFDNDARNSFIADLSLFRNEIEEERRNILRQLRVPFIPLDIDIFNPSGTGGSGSFTSRSFNARQNNIPGQLPQYRGDLRSQTPLRDFLPPSFGDFLRQLYDAVRRPGDLPGIQDLNTNLSDNTLDRFLEHINSGLRRTSNDSVAQSLQDRVDEQFENFIDNQFTNDYLSRVNQTIRDQQEESEGLLRLFEESNRQYEEAQRERRRLHEQETQRREEEAQAYRDFLNEVIQIPIDELTRTQFRERLEQTAPRFSENLSRSIGGILSDSILSDNFQREGESFGEALRRSLRGAFRNALNQQLEHFLSEQINRLFHNLFGNLLGGIFGGPTTSPIRRGNVAGGGGFVGPPRSDGTFHEGGIVGGFGAAPGQERTIRALTGEAVLNQAQKDQLLYTIANGTGGGLVGNDEGMVQINFNITGDVSRATMDAITRNSREVGSIVGSELQRVGVLR